MSSNTDELDSSPVSNGGGGCAWPGSDPSWTIRDIIIPSPSLWWDRRIMLERYTQLATRLPVELTAPDYEHDGRSMPAFSTSSWLPVALR